jgi:hypothetical protein
MPSKSPQSRGSKGPDGSNLPPSANQSVHFPYIVEKAETSHEMWHSFSPQRTREIRPTPVLPESAGILSV